MNILIIAIDHVLQKVKSAHEPQERALRKDKFEALLKQEMAKRQVEFISEESNPKVLTIAKELADANVPGIPWENIHMSDAERRKRGIYAALKNRPTHCEERSNGELVLIEHRIPEDEILETYFAERTTQGAGEAHRILVLCGDLQADALKVKLEAEGHQVGGPDHSLVDKRWI